MKPGELFDVAIRVVGIAVLVYGISDLVNAFLFQAGYFTHADMTFRYMVAGWVSIFVGLTLIRAPGILVNFAYPESPDATSGNESVEKKEGE